MRGLVVVESSLHVDAIDGIVDAVPYVSEVAHGCSGRFIDPHARKRRWKNGVPLCAARIGEIEALKLELPVPRPIDSDKGWSWAASGGCLHAARNYRILEPFTAVEARVRAAHVHGRDE